MKLKHIVIALLAVSSTPQAALYDRGGGLIYDDALNVTWLQNANIAGRPLNWYEAVSFASTFVYYDAVRNVNWDNWRLPNKNPLDPAGWKMQISTNGDNDDAYNISATGTMYAGSKQDELAYTWFNTLGNTSRCPVGAGWGGCSTANVNTIPYNTGPFTGLTRNIYWTSSNENLPYADGWGFDTGSQWGLTGAFNASYGHNAWLLRDGDVATIPVPAVGWLMLLSIAWLFGRRT